MNGNKLKLNDSKTEVILCKNPRYAEKPPEITVNINDIIIEPSLRIKNLGVIFDEDLSMSHQISNLCRNMIFQLQKISSIRPYLTEEAAKTLVTSLILSKLNSCNSLLAGITKENMSRLQSIQNHAAKLIKGKKKYDHVSPLLKELHWLPVAYRIDYKIALIVFKCINNLAPLYLQKMLTLYQPNRALRSSNDKFILEKPKYNYTSYGGRSFPFYGPFVWNSLPFNLRSMNNIDTFKRNLKHHYFLQAFTTT